MRHGRQVLRSLAGVRGRRAEALVAGLAVVVLATGVVTATTTASTRVSPTAVDLAATPAPGDTRVADTAPEAPAVGATAPVDRELDPRTPSIPALPDTTGTDDADVRDLPAFEAPDGPEVATDEVVPADLVLRGADGAELDLDALADPLGGARHVAGAASLTAAGVAGGSDAEPRELTILGVHADSFRPLTPDVTATEDAVWERFAEGDVLVSHDVADDLGVELGGDLVLTTDDASLPVRVGAFAANGAPPIADVVVPAGVAAQLGGTALNLLVVSALDDLGSLGERLAEATGGEVELLRPPAPDLTDDLVAASQTEGAPPSGDIESFTYTSRSDGRIDIHGDWVARNIVSVPIPGMGTTQCHRAMVPQLYAVIEELIARGLYDHLDPAQFAGCFVARHIDWRADKPLSMHAWGLAIDFNTRENALGAIPQMDLRVVEVFERWGFEWGGRWSRPDGMHFELDRIVPVG